MPKKAFIIGAKTLSLNYTDNDIKLLSEALEKHDYEIYSPKGGKFEVLKEFENVANSCKQADTFIFYFSGHGTVKNGKLFLEYYDNYRISIMAIFEGFLDCPASNKLIILDTCNSGNAAVDWTPSIDEDRYSLLTATKRLKPAKELDEYQASFLTYHIHKALTEDFPIDNENRITVRLLRDFLEEATNEFNTGGNPQKVEKPHLYGGNNLELAKISASYKRKESKKGFLERLHERLSTYEKILKEAEEELKKAKNADDTDSEQRISKEIDLLTNSINRLRTEIALANKEIYERHYELDKDPYVNVPIRLKDYPSIDAPNPNFVGREDHIIKILKRVIDNENIAVTGVQGMGGIGKTAIVTEICNYFKESWKETPKYPDYVQTILKDNKFFTDGFLWIRFEREETISFVLEEVFAQLGVKIVSDNPDEKLKALKSILKHKDVLIILDSAEQNVNNFKTLQHTFKNLPTIVTSRIDFTDIDTINVNQLGKIEAYNLFLKHFKKEEVTALQKEQIEKLCEAVGYLPIAIKILAQKAKVYKKDIIHLINDFRDKKLQALTFNVDLTENEKEEIRKNENAILCFKLSYDDLTEIRKDIFMRCGLFFFSFPKHFIQGNFKEQDISNELDELVRLSLIEFDCNTERYSLHPLLREFAVLNARERGIIDTMHLYKKTMYLNEDLNNLSDDDISDMFTEIEYCKDNNDWKAIVQFADKFSFPLFNKGMWVKNIQLLKFAIDATSDNDKKAYYYKELADRIGRQGKYQKSMGLFEKSLELKLDYFCHYSIISGYYRQEKYGKAYSENFKYMRIAFTDNYNVNNNFTRTSGWVFSSYYESSKAISTSIIALKKNLLGLSNQIIDLLNFSKSLADFIDILLSQGKWDGLIEKIKKLLSFSTEMNNYEMIGYFNKQLTSFYLQQNDIANAEKYLVEYKKVTSQMGSVEDINLINQHEGQVLFLQENFAEAQKYFTQIKHQHIKDFWMGKNYLRMNDLMNAKKHLNNALEYWQNQQNAVEIASIYTELSYLELKLNNEMFKSAEYLALAINTKERYGLISLQEENKVKQEFNKRYGNSFEELSSNMFKNKYIDIVPDFFIRNLPNKMKANNSIETDKEMILIPEGKCFVSNNDVNDITIFDVDFILENIENFWHGKYSNIPQATEMYLYPYYIDKYPVTNEEYKKFCIETRHDFPKHWNLNKEQKLKEFDVYVLPDKNDFGIDLDAPVTGISYQDAEKFAKYVGKEIPSEAEWEKAFWTVNYPFYKYETPVNISTEKLGLINEISEINPIQGNEKKTILKFLIDDDLYNFLMENPGILNNWKTINKQPVFDIAKIKGQFDVGHYSQLIPNISDELKNKFNWKLLLNLIGYSLTYSGYQNKLKILERLPQLNESQISKLFEVFINEAIEFYRMPEYNSSITADYLREKNFWLITVKSFIGLQSDFDIPKPTMKEFIAKNKTKHFHETKTREIIQTNNINSEKIIEQIGFRCIKPIFSNQDFKTYKLLNKKN